MDSRTRWMLVAGALVFAMACKGGGTSPSTSDPATTITIANNAVSPKTITIPRGGTVTFFNNDNRNHEMYSDPHPAHTGPTACLEINEVGVLQPDRRRASGAFTAAKTCTFHDHAQDTNTALQGTVIVQ